MGVPVPAFDAKKSASWAALPMHSSYMRAYGPLAHITFH